MLTDDSKVGLISQLMEQTFIEVPACLFSFPMLMTIWEKVHKQNRWTRRAFAWLLKEGKNSFWARKRNWESFILVWDQPPKKLNKNAQNMQLRPRVGPSTSILEGFPS